ncbi:unnamed protein product, partial [Mesorhabditis spiculigera]
MHHTSIKFFQARCELNMAFWLPGRDEDGRRPHKASDRDAITPRDQWMRKVEMGKYRGTPDVFYSLFFRNITQWKEYWDEWGGFKLLVLRNALLKMLKGKANFQEGEQRPVVHRRHLQAVLREPGLLERTTFAAKSCLVKDVEYGCIECPVGFEIDQVHPACNPWNETLAVNMELVAKDYNDATVIALPSPEDRYCEEWARCELNMNLWRPRVQDRTRRKRQFGDDDDDSDDDEDDVVAPPVDDKPYIEVDDREWEDVPHPHGEVNRIVNDENYFHAPGFFYSKFFRSLDEWKVYWDDKEEDGRKKTNIFGPFCVSEDCMENCEAETDFEVFLLHWHLRDYGNQATIVCPVSTSASLLSM